MKLKYLPLVGALTAAAPAFAITVNLTDFSFAAPADVTLTDSQTGFTFTGTAGRFDGTLDDSAPAAAALLTAAPDAITAGSFTAYCAELTQSFNFGVTYTNYGSTDGTSYFGAQKATDLSRLFTVAAGFVVDNATSAAMQAAIWEIIYEAGAYGLLSGNFQIQPQNAAYQNAFATVGGFLSNLGSVAGYQIEILVSPTQQDFLVATPVPEPGTWALLAAGLGVMGLIARRRKG